MTQQQIVAIDFGVNNSTVMDLNQYLDTLAVSKSLIDQADDLALEHEHFNTQYVIGGRVALYALLQKIYELALKLENSPDQTFLIQQMRKHLKDKHGIRTQENSSPTSIVVRYITKADRKTAHVYAKAIEAAIATNVPALEFSDYVEEQGGVEKIRASNAKTPNKSKHSLLNTLDVQCDVLDYLDSKSEFPLASFELKVAVKELQDQEFEVFVCRKRHGHYLVLDKLEFADVEDLEATLESNLCNELTQFKKTPKRLIQKATFKRQKRQIKLLKKCHPKYVTQVQDALTRKNIGLLTPNARLAWVQTQQLAKSRERYKL